MIEKILDKYFAKKLKKYISDYSLRWYLDTRFINKDNHIEFQVKLPKYKDKLYTTIYDFYKFNSLYYLLNMEDLNKAIERNIKNYLESEDD